MLAQTPASTLDGWRAYGSDQASGCWPRHPSLHLPHLTAGANRKPFSTRAQAITAATPNNAYAECGRLRGRLRRATRESSVSRALAAHQAKTAQPVGGVGLMARNLDAPEGI